MRVLAVDTATDRGSVALLEGDELVGEVRFRPSDSHSVSLLPAIDFLLGQGRLSPKDLEGFAVTLGPGSLTGLRVGISTVQGLALGAGRPALGLSTLDVLAARIVGTAPQLVAVVDAYRGDVFAGFYDGEARRQKEPEILPAGKLAGAVPQGAALIGDVVQKNREAILGAGRGLLVPTRSLYLAGTLARLAGPLLAAGRGTAPGVLAPLYMREAYVRKA